MRRPFALLWMATLPACAGETLSWRQLPPIPDPLGIAAPFAGVAGGALLVAGGANFPDKMPWEGGKKVWHDRIWLLEKPGGAWREVGKLPRPLAYGVSVTAADGMVCAGGSDFTKHYADITLTKDGSGWRICQGQTWQRRRRLRLLPAGSCCSREMTALAPGSRLRRIIPGFRNGSLHTTRCWTGGKKPVKCPRRAPPSPACSGAGSL